MWIGVERKMQMLMLMKVQVSVACCTAIRDAIIRDAALQRSARVLVPSWALPVVDRVDGRRRLRILSELRLKPTCMARHNH